MEPFYQEFAQIFPKISYKSRRKDYRGPLQDVHQSTSTLRAQVIGVKREPQVILVYFTQYFNAFSDVGKSVLDSWSYQSMEPSLNATATSFHAQFFDTSKAISYTTFRRRELISSNVGGSFIEMVRVSPIP
jgi:hypothetical protein